MKMTTWMATGAAIASAALIARSRLHSRLRSNAVYAVGGSGLYLLDRVSRPLLTWGAHRAVIGRYVDRDDPERGRFTRRDVDDILADAWTRFDTLLPGAHLEQLKTLGNRQNVMFGVVTLAMFRAFVAAGIKKGYATELVTDAAWKVYERWIVLPRWLARLRSTDPQEQMEGMLTVLLRYPFNRPGYQWEFLPGPESSQLNVYRCPVYEYFKSQGEEELFRNSWCTLDFALAQIMTKAGCYERPQTLSAGDPVCAMKWYGAGRNRQADGSQHGPVRAEARGQGVKS